MRRLLAAGLVAAAAVSGCGGEDEEDVKQLLDQAFRKEIPSAVVTADVELRVEGVEQLKEPLRLRVTGPYRSGGEVRIPAFDWDASFSGGGQTISGGLISTGANVFVNFQGTDYEVGERTIRALNRELAAAERERGGRSLASFGINPGEWLSGAKDEGDEDVAGVETTHVTAELDVGRMLDGLNTFIERAGGAVAGGAIPPPKLTDAQQREIERVVKDPVFDVYIGKQDKVVRRLAANLELDVPKEARAQVGGIESGRISFSVEFADVGEPVRIATPRSARPLAELAAQLGGLGALGEGGTGGRDGDAQPFERYSECLERADPSKIEEIQACSELLQ